MTQQQQQGRGGSARGEAERLAGDAEAKARELKGDAKGLAGEARAAAGDVAEEARRTGGTLRDEALGVVDTVRQGIAAKAEEQKGAVAERIGAIAGRVHSTADELRDREGWLADIIDRGARELDGLADAVNRRDLAGLGDAIQDYARRQPALFVGATVAAGFALARLARASLDQQGAGGGSYQGGQRYYGGGSAGTGAPRSGVRRYEPTVGTEFGTGTSAGYGTAGTSYTTTTDGGHARGDDEVGGGDSPAKQPGATEYERHMRGAAAAQGGGKAPETSGSKGGVPGGGGSPAPGAGGPAGGSAY